MRFRLSQTLRSRHPEPTDKYEVLEAMFRYGGSFVKALSLAMSKADSENFARLHAAFPEYWATYGERVREDKRASDQKGQAT